MKKIFVQIASYRDPQLIPTINDMLNHATHPERIVIGVNWQHADDEVIEDFTKENYKILEKDLVHPTDKKLTYFTLEKDGTLIKVIDLDYLKAQGACWARHRIQEMYDGEDYTLQLDSHHRFIPNWDTELIDMLESLREKSAKPVLTAYASSFDPDNDPEQRVLVPWEMNFDRFIPEGAVFFMPATIENHEELDAPIPARFYSGHFTFADGSFAKEVKHDPKYFFHGEEISIAVRAFTHGYDLYHPHKVIVWHEYTRKYRTKVWDDHTDDAKRDGKISLDWLERNNLCHRRNRILFGMDGEDPKQIDFGEYGFGDVRTLEDYEKYAGISFKKRSVLQETLDRKLPPVSQYYDEKMYPDEDSKAWVKSNDVRILVHKSELGEIVDDFDFFYVGTMDENGNELYRKDLTKDEIYKHLENEWIDYQMMYFGAGDPKSFVVWTHSESKEWMKRIEKQI